MIVRQEREFVLNTRPVEDSLELTRELQKRRIPVICDPLLSIRYFDAPPRELANVQALLFTSRNGVRAFIRQSGARKLPVFAVGDGTAEFARLQGFQCVRSAAGNVTSLVELVLQGAAPAAGELLHVAGTAVTGNLAGALRANGFDVTREAMYETQAANILSTRTLDSMKEGSVEGVVFFSPRTARTFVKLARDIVVTEQLCCVSAYCLSPAVASVVELLPWRRVLTAKAPNLKAFVELFAANSQSEAVNGE